jgi:hypothetical protein
MKAFPSLRQAAQRSIFSGSCAAVASAVALAARGHADERSAVGPLNGPSQWLWGEKEGYSRQASLRHTGVGYVTHHLSANFWAVLYETMSGAQGARKSVPRILAEATSVGALAFVVDYGITPPRFRPGFEKHVRPSSLALVYAAFSFGLAASTLLRRTASRQGLRNH